MNEWRRRNNIFKEIVYEDTSLHYNSIYAYICLYKGYNVLYIQLIILLYRIEINSNFVIHIIYCYFIWWSPFIPSRNLDEVFTYNHMALMSLPSRSRVKASMVLTRSCHLFIPTYIISL